MNPQDFANPAWVTLAYIGLYYLFMIHIMRTKVRLAAEYKARGEKFDRYFNKDRELLAADRNQLNMLEHMPVFLVLMWLNAFIVAPDQAAFLGAFYTLVRAMYPFALGRRLGRNIPLRILLFTFTGYVVLIVFAVQIAMAL
jgi:uncharacterized membrane protein YecN with MAPEG domain